MVAGPSHSVAGGGVVGCAGRAVTEGGHDGLCVAAIGRGASSARHSGHDRVGRSIFVGVGGSLGDVVAGPSDNETYRGK